MKRLVNRLFSLETVFAESLQHWKGDEFCVLFKTFTGWLSSCPAVRAVRLAANKRQVHVDEKNPSMFRELSQWVDDEGLEHAVDIFSEFLGISGFFMS